MGTPTRDELWEENRSLRDLLALRRDFYEEVLPICRLKASLLMLDAPRLIINNKFEVEFLEPQRTEETRELLNKLDESIGLLVEAYEGKAKRLIQ